MNRIKTHICIIGSGTGGLVVAAGAVQMGADVVMIEKHLRKDASGGGVMGGDCLHTGCVPSKAMLAAAKQAHTMGKGAPIGVAPQPAEVDFAQVNAHIHEVIADISPTDSVARYEKLGVKILEGQAEFISPREVQVGDTIIRANRFVVATGSSAAVPPIPGIDTVEYLTNETIFHNKTRPDHLIIIGGGPIGMEMAQAHRRLGSQVTVLDGNQVLSRDEPEAREIVRASLISDGVDLREGVRVVGVKPRPGGGVFVTVANDDRESTLEGTHLLVAAGRRPTVEGIGLDKAGIAYSAKGIEVDARLRTSNKKVFAVGDCVAGNPQFTHVAAYQAGIVIRNVLFKVPAKNDLSALPWVTYTDPELAHVGMSEAEARAAYGEDVRITTWDYHENDRAKAERATKGFAKIVTRKNGKILGATLVGLHAGEVIQPWILARSKGMKMSDMTGYIAPYPTLGEINKRVAGQFYTDTIFSPRVRFLVRTIQRLFG